MQFLIDNWMLIVVAMVSGAMLMWPALSSGGGSLNPSQAVQLMNHQKAAVIDVCEPSEYAAGHIVGARNIPLGSLEQQLTGAVKNKQVPVILVCASGMRSGRAVAVAKKLGYENAQSLSGGMGAWRSANMPVTKA